MLKLNLLRNLKYLNIYPSIVQYRIVDELKILSRSLSSFRPPPSLKVLQLVFELRHDTSRLFLDSLKDVRSRVWARIDEIIVSNYSMVQEVTVTVKLPSKSKTIPSNMAEESGSSLLAVHPQLENPEISDQDLILVKVTLVRLVCHHYKGSEGTVSTIICLHEN